MTARSTTKHVHAIRSMKARGSSCCAYCGGWVAQGSRIHLVADDDGTVRGWQHEHCVLKQQQDWSVIAKPTEAELQRRHAAEQERALYLLRRVGMRIA